jgi:glucose-6-phosphate isomerase
VKIDFRLPSAWQNDFAQFCEKPNAFENYLQVINSKERGFYHLTKDVDSIDQCEKALQKFSAKKTLVHVGIGGSALGPQFLVESLAPQQAEKNVLFIDNVDSEDIQKKLRDLNHKEAFFHIVSKSGGTIETLSNFLVILSWLDSKGVSKEQWNEYFLFSTDPDKSELLTLANENSISTLPIPSNIGGRFSLFTCVGLVPCLFLGVPVRKFFEGANRLKDSWENSDWKENPLLQSALITKFLYKEKNIDQTVMMPYLSDLKLFSHWFVQLWAESLGKNPQCGLTPIPALGANDQHSQVQLFMEGPINKLVFFIETQNKDQDFQITSPFSQGKTSELSGLSLNQLLKAELEGTMRALNEGSRPCILITLEDKSAFEIGKLCQFFMALTALMGSELGIDAFNQPGVEAGKKFALEWLRN